MISRPLAIALLAGVAVFPLEFSASGSGSLLPGMLTLAWDPSDDPSVVGYRLYEGTASQVYDTMIDISNKTTATLVGLMPGVTYYFAVTAYDATGLESTFSGEIGYTVPTSAPRPTVVLARANLASGSGNAMVLSGTGPPGTAYTILVTEDFITWTSIGTVTLDGQGSFQFMDPSSLLAPQKFYRLLQTTTSGTTASAVATPLTTGAKAKSF